MCGTCKAGSGFPPRLLKLRSTTSKQKDWGFKALTTVDDQVLACAWVDNNVVQFMTTVHSPKQFNEWHTKSITRRRNLPQEILCMGYLQIPRPIHAYNTHMGGVDSNA